MTWEPGAELERERVGRGISLEEAARATRVRSLFLRALEAGELAVIPGDAYVRGYLRTYAAYLRVDARPLLEQLPASRPAGDGLSIAGYSPRPAVTLVITGARLTASALLLVAALLGGYMAHQLYSVRPTAPAAAAGPGAVPIASPPPLTTISPGQLAAAPLGASPAAVTPVRLIYVTVRAMDTVWLSVEVDGKPIFADSGRVLEAGEEAGFVGQRIRITSGRGAATMVGVDGGEMSPLGSGVVTRDFAAQT